MQGFKHGVTGSRLQVLQGVSELGRESNMESQGLDMKSEISLSKIISCPSVNPFLSVYPTSSVFLQIIYL